MGYTVLSRLIQMRDQLEDLTHILPVSDNQDVFGETVKKQQQPKTITINY